MKKIIFLLCMVFSIAAFSAPREIVIIRHADKLKQDEPGPYLSSKGQKRASAFMRYYLSHFPNPDFIFASKPAGGKHPSESDSYRPFETVLPLANQLSYETKQNIVVRTPYYQNQYVALARDLLTQKKYQGKMILICWQHGRINLMTRDLGVTAPLSKWREHNYDQVYVLKYDANGKLASFQVLEKQYRV